MLQDSPQPPSSFLLSPPSANHDDSVSYIAPTRDKSSSESTIATLYSMYDDPRRSHNRSTTPPDFLDTSLHNSQGKVVHSAGPSASIIPSNEKLFSLHGHASNSFSHSDDTTSESQMTHQPYPPKLYRPQLNTDASTIRPSTAPSANSQNYLSHGKADEPRRRSTQVNKQKVIQNGSPVLRVVPLMLEKPTPPTPVESPASFSQHIGLDESTLPPEDPDAHHVRTTYAKLDVTGVRGDGYEDGIELTRARLNADLAPIGSAMSQSRTLERAELETLRAVDRYGFYSLPSSDRSVLLPKTKPLSVFKATESSKPASPSHLSDMPVTYPDAAIEQRRIDKWEKMLSPSSLNSTSWNVNPQLESKLRERVYKGIPDRWRRVAWDVLISRWGKAAHRRYEHLLLQPSEYDIQIDLDVPRTISGHVMFRTRYGQGQRSLFHVLHAFSLHCLECGYCQGMGPIAATFLCYVEPQKAHDWMCHLHTNYAMHKIFGPGFPGLLENIYIQERITERFMPGVYAAFRKHTVSTTSYATKWYITLFANTVPFQMQLRLLDGFLLEGMDLIVVTAVAIVWTFREHIIAKSATFETILSLLSAYFVPENEDDFMRWILKVMSDNKLRSDIQKWRNDWANLIRRGEDGTALL